jgi:cardiolipin synthase
VNAALAMGAHLPNLISLARLGLAPLIVWQVLAGAYPEAFWLLLLAGISDAIDGVLARMLKAQSFLGRFLDPVSDKILLVGLFVALAWQGELPVWLVALAVSRDAAILAGAGLLYWLRSPEDVPGPSFVSKLNTALQTVLAATVLAVAAFQPGAAWPAAELELALIAATAATTTVSGAGYARSAGARLLAPAEAP